jgi:hypothetical protein
MPNTHGIAAAVLVMRVVQRCNGAIGWLSEEIEALKRDAPRGALNDAALQWVVQSTPLREGKGNVPRRLPPLIKSHQ